jgi:hypothetical protein
MIAGFFSEKEVQMFPFNWRPTYKSSNKFDLIVCAMHGTH